MTHPRLLHADLIPPGRACHFHRAVLPEGRAAVLHDHDFPELIWVQNGRVRHRVNGAVQDLAEGDLLFIRPADLHGLRGQAPETMVAGLCLHPDLVAAIGARHPDLAGRFFWSGAALPQPHHRDMRQLAELSRAALALQTGGQGALEAEAFLMPLLAALLREGAGLSEAAPGWLVAACAAARRPEVYRAGAAGLARAAGRAHAHVSRSMRRHMGQSPSEFINGIRMEEAARALSGSDESLAEIAAGVGLANLGHFHRLFRDHHGMPPAQFRQSRQRNVLRPAPSRH